jgi:hypothetical protein
VIPDAWGGAAGSVARLGVLREVAEHRPDGLRQQLERGAQHAMLQLGIVGAPERHPERERHEERPRRLHLLGVLADETDRRRRNTRLLQRSGQHTPGVGAVRSGRRDQGHVDTLLAKTSPDLGDRSRSRSARARAERP